MRDRGRARGEAEEHIDDTEQVIDLGTVQGWREWLGGGPVLEELLQEPDVRKAIRSGSPLRVHGALSAKARALSTADRRDIQPVLDDQRLFAEEVAAPTLSRINGVGTTMAGTERRAPDGSYIKTQAVSVFWIPLLPLRQFWVTDADEGWYFHGQVPMSAAARRWRTGAWCALGAAILIALGAFWHAGRVADVHVANGFDVPLTVRLGDETLRVEPHETTTIEVPARDLRVSASTVDGLLLEELDVEVPGRSDAVVYNPLGAAPVFKREIVYSSNTLRAMLPGPEPETVPPSGTSWDVFEDIEYVFQPPPKSISTRSRKDVSRYQVICEAGGWKTTVAWLAAIGRTGDAARIACAAATVPPVVDDDLFFAAWHADRAGSDDDFASFAFLAEERAPESDGAQRLAQTARLRSQPMEVVAEHYRARLATEPEQEQPTLLLSSVLPLHESLELLEDAATRRPDWQDVAAVRRNRLASMGRFDEAAQLVEDPPRDAESLRGWRTVTTCLAAAGRHEDALDFLLELFDSDSRWDWGMQPVSRYHRIRRLSPAAGAGRPDVNELLGDGGLMATEGPSTNADRLWMAVTAGEYTAIERFADGVSADDVAAAEVVRDAHLTPATAVIGAIALDEDVLARFPSRSLVAIGCAAAKVGSRELADRVHRALPWWERGRVPRTAFDRPATLLDRQQPLHFEVAAELHRAAALRAAGEEREGHMQAARRLDPLGMVLPPAGDE